MKKNKKNIITLLASIILLTSCVFCSWRSYAATTELKNVENKLVVTQKNLLTEIDKNNSLSKELKRANKIINDLKDSEYKLVCMGDFKITHYCVEKRAHICGGGNGITATGTKVTAGRSIAVDPSVIPYGTQVYIEGYGFRTAEDCGGAVGGNHLDVAVNSHSEAMSLGTVSKGVWMLVKKP